jgi:SSS family solute:Na+ symporter
MSETSSSNTLALTAFLGYLTLVIVIGFVAMKFSSKGIREFFIGGRKMNRFVVALSAVVSGRSAWLLLGVTNGRLRILLTLVILIFMMSYVAAQFVAGGKAFSASFDIDQTHGIFLTAAIVLLYTILGGFFAVSLTDMFQAIFMIVALLLLPVIAISDRGGLLSVLNQLHDIDIGLIDPFNLSVGAAIGFLGIGLGSPGNPHIIARYMSINDPKQLRFSAVVGTIWNVCMAWGALFIGLSGRVYFSEIAMLPGADTENLYPVLAQQLLHPLLFGIVIASIFAAIMSTADSQLLVAASSVVRDIYEKVINRGKVISPKKLVLYSRIVVLMLVLFSLLFGLLGQELVFWLVLFAWAGLGAALGPTSILALYWRKTTRSGIIWGIIVGTITTIVWYYTPFLKVFVYELVPAFILGFLVTILVSKWTTPPEDTDNMFMAMQR